MKMMRTAFFALLLSAGVAVGSGTSASVSWVLPTSYNDGMVLPPTEIASVTVQWRPTPTGAPVGTKTLQGAAVLTTVPVPCGSVYFEVFVTTTATALYPNANSPPGVAPTVYATGVTCTPNPPSGVLAK